MQKRTVTGLALATCFSLNCFAGPVADACVKDLGVLPGFLLENDAAPGTYVDLHAGGAMSYERVKLLEPRRPLRVAILIDDGCGSACEQFALQARQSFSVKLIGQHTFGSLDYSNLAPHDLPSGRRRLWYATTRSTRIPGLMVDVAGVPPDIYLPIEAEFGAKQEEVRRVRSWLEGGSLAPLQGRAGPPRPAI